MVEETPLDNAAHSFMLAKILNLSIDDCLSPIFVKTDISPDQLAELKQEYIISIMQSRDRFPNIDSLPTLNSSCWVFMATHDVDPEASLTQELARLNPEDSEYFDSLMELATTIAVAHVSKILTKEEIDTLLKR
ncbi:hypothetical protein A2125_00120 [Candidatus Woesebacteria bacterium GWB1_43_5]|uniref:Uncharacterized protein n=1 Tax=Candidatus Woesebacteria bacterium GWB1_43_5 TaxID=1802474 RepID=A0A1F7WSA7_9BACT|nr:MAG: hypothetical protein A2125_00120 [Candidatus Woesebacteria bacterium GWB1_43_5]